MRGDTQTRSKTGRPIEYPDSPLHIYWRELKRQERERKRTRSRQPIEPLDSTPSGEAASVVEVSEEGQ